MELLERNLYLTDLGKWLGAASAAGRCIALVGGEAGIGKTALLQEFSKQLRKTRVLWDDCARGVRGVPRGRRSSTRSNAHGLTGREAQVFALLSAGLRNSIIAKRLFVSPKTVEHHVSAILAKFGVASRAAAVAMVREKSVIGS